LKKVFAFSVVKWFFVFNEKDLSFLAEGVNYIPYLKLNYEALKL